MWQIYDIKSIESVSVRCPKLSEKEIQEKWCLFWSFGPILLDHLKTRK